MTRSSHLFRDAALERLNSPEQLDQRIAVIPNGMRLLAMAFGIVIVGSLVWALIGSVPTRVLGRGVLIADEDGDFAIAATSAGLVAEIRVRPGDRVESGSMIARVEQRALGAQLVNTRNQVTRLEANLATLKAANEAQIRKSDETTRHQLAAIDEQISAAEQRRERLRQLLAGYESLRGRGMISQVEMLNKQDQFDQTVLDLANARAKRVDVEATFQKKLDDLAEIERQKQIEIEAKKSEADHLRVQVEVGSVVKSSETGVIREVRVGRGDVVAAGAVLATVGHSALEKLEVFALLRGEMRKRVQAGMDVQVIPDGSHKEEYGSMRGRVLSVSDGDVSVEHIDQILRNPQLTKSLVGNDAPLLARIELSPSKETISGFTWWSGSGPPHKITAGTVATVEIIVDRARPIALIIPALRKLLSIAP